MRTSNRCRGSLLHSAHPHYASAPVCDGLALVRARGGDRQCAHCAGHGGGRVRLLSPRQRSEQYFTWSHTRSHFLRQRNGRPQCMQGFSGNSCFLRMAMRRLSLTGGGWSVDEAKHVMSRGALQMPVQATRSVPLATHGQRGLASLPRIETDTLLSRADGTGSLLSPTQAGSGRLLSPIRTRATSAPATIQGSRCRKHRIRALGPYGSLSAWFHRSQRGCHAADQQHAASHRDLQRIANRETAVFQPTSGQPQLGHRAADDILGPPHVVVLAAHGDPLGNTEAGLAQRWGGRWRWICRRLFIGHGGDRTLLWSGTCDNRSL